MTCVFSAFLLALIMAPATRTAAKDTPKEIPNHVYFSDIQGLGCEIWDDKCDDGSPATSTDQCVSWFGNSPTMNASKRFPWANWQSNNHLCAQDNMWWHSGERFDMERAIEKFVTKNYGPDVHEDPIMRSWFKDSLTRADLVVIFARLLNSVQQGGGPFTLEADVNTKVVVDGENIPHGPYINREEVLYQRTNEPTLYDDVRALHPSFMYMEEVVDRAIFEHVHTLQGMRAAIKEEAPAPGDKGKKDSKKEGKKEDSKDSKDKKDKKKDKKEKARTEVSGVDYEWKDVDRSINPLEDLGEDRRAFPDKYVTREEFIASFVALVDYMASDKNSNDAKYSFDNYYCGPGVNQSLDNFKYYAGIVDRALELNQQYTRFSDVSLTAGDVDRREDVDAAQLYPGFIAVAMREGLIDSRTGATADAAGKLDPRSGITDIRLKPDRYIDRSEAVAILSKFFIGNWNERSCPGMWDASGTIDAVNGADRTLAVKKGDTYLIDNLAYLYVRDCWNGDDVAEVREISTDEFLNLYTGDKLNTRRLCYLNVVQDEKAQVRSRIQQVVDYITWHQRTYMENPARVEPLIQTATADGWDATLRKRIAELTLDYSNIMIDADDVKDDEKSWSPKEDSFTLYLRIPPEQSKVQALCVPGRDADTAECIKPNGSNKLLGYLEVDMSHREHAPRIPIATFTRHYGRVTGVDMNDDGTASRVTMLLMDPAKPEKALGTQSFNLDINIGTFGSRAWSKAIKMPGAAYIDQTEPVLGEIAIVYTLKYHNALQKGAPAQAPALTATTDPAGLPEQVVLYQPEVWNLYGRLRAMQIDTQGNGKKDKKDLQARLAVELLIDPLGFDVIAKGDNQHFRKNCSLAPALYENPNDRTVDLFRTRDCEMTQSAASDKDSFNATGYNVVLNRIRRSNMTAACSDRYEPWTKAPTGDYDFCKLYFDIFQNLQYSQGVGAWNIYTQSLLGIKDPLMVNVMAEEISLQDK
jgi:hypothetical protein